jgi:hypothetical protein
MRRQHVVHRRGLLRGSEKQTMQIGEPIRIIVVEPLELPIKEAQKWREPIAMEPDPEEEPATK